LRGRLSPLSELAGPVSGIPPVELTRVDRTVIDYYLNPGRPIGRVPISRRSQ
jgi:hypothetical protein